MMGSSVSTASSNSSRRPSVRPEQRRTRAPTTTDANGSARASSEHTALETPEAAGGMEQLAVRAGRARMNAVDLHSVCGYTKHGVPAFSNGTSNTWTNTKSYLDGVFMGYRWQCVEFARRWLWTTHRLLLPERNCAYCFANSKYVYRLKEDPHDVRRLPVPVNGMARRGMEEEEAPAATIMAPARASPSAYTTTSSAALFNAALLDETDAATVTPAVVLGPRKDAEAWERVPAVFVKQGSTVPPVANSLIVYPMSLGSPWGHIGVITDVDLQRGVVYVADQNRYFHHWGHRGHSAVFPLEVSRGRYYIRDHESECKGWLTFPNFVEGH